MVSNNSDDVLNRVVIGHGSPVVESRTDTSSEIDIFVLPNDSDNVVSQAVIEHPFSRRCIRIRTYWI